MAHTSEIGSSINRVVDTMNLFLCMGDNDGDNKCLRIDQIYNSDAWIENTCSDGQNSYRFTFMTEPTDFNVFSPFFSTIFMQKLD